MLLQRLGLGPGAHAAAWRRVAVAAAALLLAALAAGLTSVRVPGLEVIERGWHDHLLRRLADAPAPAEPVIVQIDERSLQQLGPWPWPRELLAQLAQRLREQGARLQVWDVLLPEPALGDTQLAEQLRHGDIVLGQAAVLDPEVDPAPREGQLLAATDPPPLCSSTAEVRGYIGVAPTLTAATAGLLNATRDADGRLRRLPAVVCVQQGGRLLHYPQLVLAAAAAAEPQAPWVLKPGEGPLEPHRWLQRGRWRFALDEHGWITIPYQRPHTLWPALSVAQLLLDEPETAQAKVPPLAGRVVLLGATALGVGDVTATPLHSHAPGVSIHAELMAQALAAPSQRWPAAPPRAAAWVAAVSALVSLVPLLWVISWAAGGSRDPGSDAVASVDMPAIPPLWAVSLGVLLALGLPLFNAALLYTLAGRPAPVAGPLMAAAMGAAALVLGLFYRQRLHLRRLARALQSFVPAPLARQIAHQALPGGSLGYPQEGCLLGLHIQGLHPWVGRADTLQALALTHALHATVQRVAQAHGGTMEYAQGGRYYLGWPRHRQGAVESALACARALYAEVKPLLAANETELRPLSAWLALEWGGYLLGLVGGEQGRRLILLGPVANDVSAMLDLAPELACPIMVGPQAVQALQASLQAGPALRSLGVFQLPDRSAPREFWLCEP